MRAGDLDRRIVIETNTPAADAYGEPVPSWATLATVWSQVEPLTGRELFDSQQTTAEADTRFTIRYRSDVTEGMRINYGSDLYNISHVAEIGRQEGTSILATAQVP